MYTIKIKNERTYEFTKDQIEKLEMLYSCLTDCDINTIELTFKNDPKIFDIVYDIVTEKKDITIESEQKDVLCEYLDYYLYKGNDKVMIIIGGEDIFLDLDINTNLYELIVGRSFQLNIPYQNRTELDSYRYKVLSGSLSVSYDNEVTMKEYTFLKKWMACNPMSLNDIMFDIGINNYTDRVYKLRYPDNILNIEEEEELSLSLKIPFFGYTNTIYDDIDVIRNISYRNIENIIEINRNITLKIHLKLNKLLDIK